MMEQQRGAIVEEEIATERWENEGGHIECAPPPRPPLSRDCNQPETRSQWRFQPKTDQQEK